LLILNNDRFFYYLAITVVYIALKVPTVYKWIEKRKKT